jgi:hypothetical protein
MPAEAAAADRRRRSASIGAGDLAQDLHADGALPGDDVGVVERVDQREAALAGQGSACA